MKIRLLRIKKDVSQKKFFKIPDYECLFRGKNNAVYSAIGYLGGINSDIDLKIEQIDLNEWVKDKYKYAKLKQFNIV